MGMIRRKNLAWTLIVVILISTAFTVALIGSGTGNPGVALYVDPSLNVAGPGTTFDIYITASDVEDLFLTEIYLSWDPPLLYTDAGSINPGDVAPYLEQIWIENVNNDEGWLHVSTGRPIGVKEGLSGTVQIAKITFLVEGDGPAVGVEPRLKDSVGQDMTIDEVIDGSFRSEPVVHDVAVTDVTASPTIVTSGELVNINVTVNNPGTEPETFNVTAYNRGYLVLSPDGDGAYTDWEGDHDDWDDWPSLDAFFVSATLDGKYESSTLANHTDETWTIEKVIVNIEARNNETSDEEVRLMLVIGGTEHLGSAYAPLNATYTKYTSEWTTNPETLSAWTWSDIDALEAGVGSEQVGLDWTGRLEVTQLYVEVIGAWQSVSLGEEVTDLAAGASKNLTFTWSTTGFAGGIYTIKAEADVVLDEKNTANNMKEADDKVTIQIRDIAITSVTTEPTKVVVGDRVSIKVTVVNEGNVPETFNVSVYYDLTFIENKTITDLWAGDKREPKVEWDTSGVAEGNYTIRAEVPPLPGEVNTTNNVKEADEKVSISLHNIEIKEGTLKVSPNIVAAGDPVSINVTIRNKGKVEDTFNASIYYDTTLIETRTDITLPNGTSIILEFTWNTTGVAEGTYTIKAEVPPVPGEVKIDDNTRTGGQVTVSATLIHDIAVTDVTASPTEVTVGDLVSINVTVVNEGDFIETLNVTAYYDDTAIETKTVLLLGNKNKTITFTWNTTDVGLGVYTIKANATVVEGETDTAGNEMFFDGTVTVLVHDVAVTDVTASPTEVTVGDSVSISVTVVNQGGFTETFTLTIYANTTLIDSRNVTLTSGISTTETFTWDTSGFATADYVIKAEASVVPDETDTADNTFEGDTVTVKEVTGPSILLYAVAGIVIAVVAATILIYFLRVRKRKVT